MGKISMSFLSQEKVLILGTGGQVGRSLLALLRDQPTAQETSVIGLTRAEADLSQVESVLRQLDHYQPTVVINAAAYTQVDRAESEQDLALAINGDAPGRLAEWCFRHGALFVHYSTDYVFPGMGDRPWKENDPIDPLNFYGKSKRMGEEKILQAASAATSMATAIATVAATVTATVTATSAASVSSPRFLVFRTSWVYDSEGKNFLLTMLRLGKEKESLSVVSDQIGAPTYAPDLALATLQAIENSLTHGKASSASNTLSFPSGIYHLCGSGQTSWHEFACEIFREFRNQVKELPGQKIESNTDRSENNSKQLEGKSKQPENNSKQSENNPLKIQNVQKILTADYPTPAKRPLNSRMNTDLAYSKLGVRLRDWRIALKACIETLVKGAQSS